MHLRSTVFQGLPHELFGSLLREGGELFKEMVDGDKILVVIEKDTGEHPCALVLFKGQLLDFGVWADSFYNASKGEKTPSTCAIVKLPAGFNPDRSDVPARIKFAIDAYMRTLPEHTD